MKYFPFACLIMKALLALGAATADNSVGVLIVFENEIVMKI